MYMRNIDNRTIEDNINKGIYLDVLEVIPDSVVIQRNLKVLYANNNFKNLLKLNTNTKLIGENILQFIHTENEEEFIRFNTEVERNKLEPILEIKIQCKDGSQKYIESHRSIININEEKAILSVIRDITSRKYLENHIKQNERKYKELLEFLPFAVIKYDDKKILYGNKKAVELLGYENLFQLKNKPLEIFKHPDYEEIYTKRIKKLSEDQVIMPLEEMKIINSNGKTIDIEITSTRCYKTNEIEYLAIIKDVTEKKRIEKDLNNIVNKFNALTENSSDYIIIHSNYDISYINENALKLLRYNDKTQIIGNSFLKIVPKEFQNEAKKRLDYQYETGKSYTNVETKVITSDGEIIELLISTINFTLEEKSAVMVVGKNIHDELSNLTEEIKKKEKKIREFSKLNDTKSEFFAIMSHELKTPLNVNLSTLQLLELYNHKNMLVDKKDSIKKYIYTMKKNCYRQLKIINNSIDISKINLHDFSTRFKYYDIVDIVNKIVNEIKHSIEYKNIDIRFFSNVNKEVVRSDSYIIEKMDLCQ